MVDKKIVVSGVQPTGKLHLGNYLGVIKQWKTLQEDPQYDCRFGIMDLHAMTVEKFNSLEETDQDDSTMTTLKQLKDLGIKSERIFIQSDLDRRGFGVTRLFWGLCCNTTMSQLSRMTQFKEKVSKQNESVGLFTYPILMAADILVHKADLVPVGADQMQHLELARALAKKLGLKIPEPLINKESARIMSLIDPTKKMSKSDPNDGNRINLSDDFDTIHRKLAKAATTDKGCANLETIYVACGGPKDFLNWDNAKHAKEKVAEQIIQELQK